MTLQTQPEQQLDSNNYLICIEPNCLYRGYSLDNICPACYSIAIVIDKDEMTTAPDGADVLEYINEQMGFK